MHSFHLIYEHEHKEMGKHIHTHIQASMEAKH